jgi:hypothetical protein
MPRIIEWVGERLDDVLDWLDRNLPTLNPPPAPRPRLAEAWIPPRPQRGDVAGRPGRRG